MTVLHLGQEKQVLGEPAVLRIGRHDLFLVPIENQPGIGQHAPILNPQARTGIGQNGFPKTATETEAFLPDLSALLIQKVVKTESESQDHSQEEMRGPHAATIAQAIPESLLAQNQETKTPLAHPDFRINHPQEVPASLINPVGITRAMPKENQADRSKREVLIEIPQGLNPPAPKKREGIQLPQKEKIDPSAGLKRKVQAPILHLQHAENHR